MKRDDPVVDFAVRLVFEELSTATRLNGAIHSAHEGFAVILEEVDEMKAEVWKKERLRDPGKMVKEAAQVAAMGLRFLIDIAIPELLKDPEKYVVTTDGKFKIAKTR